MLKQRILTAVALLPLALAVVLLAPVWIFDLVLVAVIVLLAVEFGALCLAALWLRAAFVVAAAALLVAALVNWPVAVLRNGLLIGAVVLWVLAPLWFMGRQRIPGVVKALLGLVLLAGAGVALHELKAVAPDGRWLLMVFLLVWSADIGAYAAGRLLGRHRLAPSISPGKTWEGFVGGLVLALLIGLAAGKWMLGIAPGIEWAGLLFAAVTISVIGDLLESLLKRQAGVKDSGRLLPGHGGIFDRLDSLLAAAPMLWLIGIKIGIFSGISGVGG